MISLSEKNKSLKAFSAKGLQKIMHENQKSHLFSMEVKSQSPSFPKHAPYLSNVYGYHNGMVCICVVQCFTYLCVVVYSMLYF